MPTATDSDLARLWPVFRSWAPPPDMTVSQWADEYGIIPPGVSGQAGNQHFTARPPQRAILDAFGTPRIRTIDVQKSARIGWTLIVQLVLGYWVHQAPRSSLVVQPVEDDCKEWAKESLEPFVEDSPVLEPLFSPFAKQSTLSQKFFVGGSIRLRGAQTGRGFRRFTVGGVLLDEVDAYPPVVGDEGDPVRLAAVRAETIWDSVVARGSTPLLDGLSRIQSLIAVASVGWYILTCPHEGCGTEHVRLFRQPDEPLMIGDEVIPVSHVVWPEGEPAKAAYVCPGCGAEVTQAHHTGVMAGGYWKGPDWSWTAADGFTFAESFTGRIGFRIWAGYNATPSSTPAALALDWVAAARDTDARQVFINTRLGEPYKEAGEQPAATGLLARCEDWGPDLDCPVDPDGITAMVDIQGEWFEVEVCAWRFHTRESWSIDHLILPATPDSDASGPDWSALARALSATYVTPSGPRYVDAVGIDVGYLQDRAMAFVRVHGGGRTFPFKGFGSAQRPNAPIVESLADRIKRLTRQAKHASKVNPVLVGVDAGKLAVYRALQVTEEGPGYCHFPAGRTQEYFDALTAERMVTRYRKGFPVREWHKVRERNEALDCRVGNLAVCILMEQGVIHRRPAPDKPRRTAGSRPTRPRSSFAPDGWSLGG